MLEFDGQPMGSMDISSVMLTSILVDKILFLPLDGKHIFPHPVPFCFRLVPAVAVLARKMRPMVDLYSSTFGYNLSPAARANASLS